MTTPTIAQQDNASPTRSGGPDSIVLQHGSSSGGGAGMAPSPTGVPVLWSANPASSASGARIELNFSTAMARGAGTIYITDGAAQTVIDRVTGQPTLRIVGATDTKMVSASSVTIDGSNVMIETGGLKAGHAYSVVMAPGVLVSATNKPFAGVTNPGQIKFTTAPAGDIQPPTLTSIVLDGSTLGASNTITATITFSEPVAALTAAAITVPNATLSGLHTTDNGKTWQGTLAGAAGNHSNDNVLSVNLSMVRDLAGNAGSGSATSPNYSVDTIVDTYLSPILLDDNGPSATDTVTNHLWLQGHFIGDLAAGQYVELTINDTVITRDRIDTIPAEMGGGWGFSPLGGEFGDGNYHISARLVDGNGHSSVTVSQDVTLDNHAPVILTAPGSDGTALNIADAIVITFGEAMYLDRDSAGHTMVQITNVSNNSVTSVYIDERNFSEDRKTLTISADDHHLVTGNDYSIRLRYDLTDLAGNQLGEHPIDFHTAGAYTDLAAPHAVQAIADTAGYYGVGEKIKISVLFNEPVRLVDGPLPSLLLNTGGVATYTSISGDGRSVFFEYTVAEGDRDVARLDVESSSGLVGRLEDLAGHDLESAHIDYSSLGSWGGDILVDGHTPLAVSAPILWDGLGNLPDSDTIANHPRPTFHGSGAEADASIRLYEGGTAVGWGYADADGHWTANIDTGGLADGVHTLTARQSDYANESAASTSVTITIDTLAPNQLAAPLLAASSDTGISDSDHITKDATPTFSGVGEAHAIIRLYDGDTEVGHAEAGDTGAWSVTASELADGVHSLRVRQFDIAGNTSLASLPTSVTIDTTAATVIDRASPALAGFAKLMFSEAVVLTPTTALKALNGLNLVSQFVFGSTDWSITNDANGAASVLEYHGLALGTYRIEVTPGTLADVAGNAVIIGAPDMAGLAGPLPLF